MTKLLGLLAMTPLAIVGLQEDPDQFAFARMDRYDIQCRIDWDYQEWNGEEWEYYSGWEEHIYILKHTNHGDIDETNIYFESIRDNSNTNWRWPDKAVELVKELSNNNESMINYLESKLTDNNKEVFCISI